MPGRCRAPGCGTSAAHDGQLRTIEQGWFASDEKQRRGIVDFCQQSWVAWAVPHQQMLARALQPSHSSQCAIAYLGTAPGIDGGLGNAQRSPGRSGSTERGGGTAEGFEQRSKASQSSIGEAMQA